MELGDFDGHSSIFQHIFLYDLFIANSRKFVTFANKPNLQWRLNN